MTSTLTNTSLIIAGSTAISGATSAGYINNINQNLGTSSTPTFNSLVLNNQQLYTGNNYCGNSVTSGSTCNTLTTNVSGVTKLLQQLPLGYRICIIDISTLGSTNITLPGTNTLPGNLPTAIYAGAEIILQLTNYNNITFNVINIYGNAIEHNPYGYLYNSNIIAPTSGYTSYPHYYLQGNNTSKGFGNFHFVYDGKNWNLITSLPTGWTYTQAI